MGHDAPQVLLPKMASRSLGRGHECMEKILQKNYFKIRQKQDFAYAVKLHATEKEGK